MVQRVRRLQNEREGGFTLIELLIVIVVLGILAGIVVLGLGTFKQDATTAACKADAKQVQISIDAFLARPGAPATVSASSTATSSVAGDYGFLTAAPAILKSVPDSAAKIGWTAAGEVANTC